MCPFDLSQAWLAGQESVRKPQTSRRSIPQNVLVPIKGPSSYEAIWRGEGSLNLPKPGEFCTPISLVRLIVEIIEPFHGKILDPACGSGQNKWMEPA
ncbi:MAG TPA: N-6 DNA methylase [Nitrososphaerales archaeon]|nr:N-6 DNA methylase [Nitrososphaerales archaeon]